jgi:hypothetical protein
MSAKNDRDIQELYSILSDVVEVLHEIHGELSNAASEDYEEESVSSQLTEIRKKLIIFSIE